jgi:glycosyltransferase involved in cell wall biosynthesis
MKNVVWVGNPYLAPALLQRGWEITLLSSASAPFTWEDLVRSAGFEPDLVVLGDESRPPVLLNPERFPCPTLFYCVDSHIHSWYPMYAQSFDLVTVAMRDHLPCFATGRLSPEQLLWLPLYAREEDHPQAAAEEMDIVFVGKNDPLLTPGRYRLLSELSCRIPGLTVLQGDYRQIYGRSKLVLNVAEHGDLNFRVFEALGCGKCLLTPQVGHGMRDLFRNGIDLFAYDQNSVGPLASCILELLADARKREGVARSGYERVNARHRPRHRAATLSQWIDGLDLKVIVRKRLENRAGLHGLVRPLYLLWAESVADPALRERYLASARPSPGLTPPRP